jgi:DNA-binding transcriptional regulator YdaS (Cro superfamily)
VDLKTFIATSELGTSKKLAESLGVSKSMMSQMVSGKAPISIERCVEIEVATDGVVSRKDLRPDDWPRIWPELRDTQPAAA